LLYSKNSQKYRTRLFTDFTVNKIYDFTHLRRDLFHKAADTPVIAIIAQNILSTHQDIEHVVVKRMVSSEKKIRFEIDYYDFHKVPWSWAIDENKKFIWKTNLLGGGRLFHLIYRLNSFPTLGMYIENKQKKNDWKFNIGYIIGNENQKNTASYITNQDSIVSIDSNGKVNTEVETSQTFEAVRDEKLFQPPFLLLKDVIGNENIPVYLIENYKNKYLTFKRKFTGLSVPKGDIEELRLIYDAIRNRFAKLYQLHVLANSASVIVKQETYLNKEDIEALPFDSNFGDNVNLSKTENLILFDVLNYYIHLGKSIAFRSSGKILQDSVNKKQLESFGITFCNSLNEIYETDEKCWQIGTSILTTSYIIYQFGYGKIGELKFTDGSLPDNGIKELIEDKLSNSGAIYQRVIRVYTHIDNYDCIFFIKPLAQRYWLNSIALRDADDTFLDLKQAGY
jgi:hypothetical protein